MSLTAVQVCSLTDSLLFVRTGPPHEKQALGTTKKGQLKGRAHRKDGRSDCLSVQLCLHLLFNLGMSLPYWGFPPFFLIFVPVSQFGALETISVPLKLCPSALLVGPSAPLISPEGSSARPLCPRV